MGLSKNCNFCANFELRQRLVLRFPVGQVEAGRYLTLGTEIYKARSVLRRDVVANCFSTMKTTTLILTIPVLLSCDNKPKLGNSVENVTASFLK